MFDQIGSNATTATNATSFLGSLKSNKGTAAIAAVALLALGAIGGVIYKKKSKTEDAQADTQTENYTPKPIEPKPVVTQATSSNQSETSVSPLLQSKLKSFDSFINKTKR